ncbi:D-tyrosyl-tRNA(Tyr) deacylase [Lachnospiraceae bacterium YSD2013]|nr:D-tyrosyl-tRNA(Tyr) deacylase [Lachnospiraceae bacterium YSD2013]
MRLLIQLVNHASVTVDDRVTGSIDKGYLVFVGVSDSDTVEIADKMLKKLVNLRIFKDENDKTNLSINDVGGSLLLVSQFTLYADARKGNRPSFTGAGAPDHANALYEHMISEARNTYSLNTQTGEFGADMKVSLENDGPFTIMLDSDEILK